MIPQVVRDDGTLALVCCTVLVWLRSAVTASGGCSLRGKLQGTESVKEFLVAKLKETEAALKRSLDEKGLTLRQSASDQEVISFLDSRTQVIMDWGTGYPP